MNAEVADPQRRKQVGLELFLRALWGHDYAVRLSAPALRTARASFDQRTLVLPDTSEMCATALDFARAAHVAAHVEFSGERFSVGSLKPVQSVLVSLLEDARVEALAMARYPGLGRWWAPFHVASPEHGEAAGSLLARLSRALFEPDYADPNGWVQRARAAFERDRSSFCSSALSRELGSVLGNDLGQMRLPFDATGYVVEPCYRDDHSGLWQRELASGERSPRAESAARERAWSRSAAEPAKPMNVLDAADADALEEADAADMLLTRYPEWDYLIGRERPAFCCVREQPVLAKLAACTAPAGVVQATRSALRRAHARVTRRRRCQDGQELDVSALVNLVTERRLGRDSELRVFVGSRRARRASSTLLLLDLSASLETASGGRAAPFRLARQLVAALSAALPSWLELAVHGFYSLGRADVRYLRFSAFHEAGLVSQRLPEHALSGSTRLGAAVRHATHLLAARAAPHKLLLVVSDAEPADIDVFDARYLVEDARQANQAARARGVGVFGLCLGQRLGSEQLRIFRQAGQPHCDALAQLSQLPRQVQSAYSRSMLGSRATSRKSVPKEQPWKR